MTSFIINEDFKKESNAIFAFAELSTTYIDVSTLDLTNKKSLIISIFNNIIAIIHKHFGDKFDCTIYDDTPLLNINLKGYKNYISIYDTTFLDEEYNKLVSKYGDIYFSNNKVYINEVEVDFEDCNSYLNERDEKYLEIRELTKKSEFKNFDINREESNIINKGIHFYIERHSLLLKSHIIKIENIKNNIKGLNYELQIKLSKT